MRKMIYEESGAEAVVYLVDERTTGDLRELHLLMVRQLRPSPRFGELPEKGAIFRVSSSPWCQMWSLVPVSGSDG
jgi:hypothetical protein